jgi:hypothetical protein
MGRSGMTATPFSCGDQDGRELQCISLEDRMSRSSGRLQRAQTERDELEQVDHLAVPGRRQDGLEQAHHLAARRTRCCDRIGGRDELERRWRSARSELEQIDAQDEFRSS